MDERVKIRLALARGHWLLGEHDEAIDALERLVAEAPEAEGLSELIDELWGNATQTAMHDERAQRLAALQSKLAPEIEPEPEPAVSMDEPALAPGSPLATPTMARLLADQGHADEALAVAEDVLRQDPTDARARELSERLGRGRQVERLERWLGRIQRHMQRGATA